MKPSMITREIHGGTQHLFRFPNGYGASVVEHPYSYGGPDGLKELGVMKFYGDGDYECRLCYDTPITDDVLGHLTAGQVELLLGQIAALPPVEVQP
jgi:hypothetical protein